MAAIMQTTFSLNYIFFSYKAGISIKIGLKFVSEWLIENKSSLVQVMALGQTGEKLSESIIA